MSLKTFHVVFIALSILMCLVVGVWGLLSAKVEDGAIGAWIGYGGFVAAAMLGVYGVWFLNKLRRFSYV